MVTRKTVGMIAGVFFWMAVVVQGAASAGNLADLRQSIAAAGANWTAGETSVTRMTPEEQNRLCGGLAEITRGDAVTPMAALPAQDLPASYSWRDVNGKNYVTPVRNQQTCGSCFVFAPVAALEARLLRTYNRPGTDIDLSEQIPLSCAGAGNCAAGGYASTASTYLQTTGTAKETCYPYTNTDGSCGAACANWQLSPYKATNWSYANQTFPATTAMLKTAVLTKGPVVARMVVYSDLYDYTGAFTARSTGRTRAATLCWSWAGMTPRRPSWSKIVGARAGAKAATSGSPIRSWLQPMSGSANGSMSMTTRSAPWPGLCRRPIRCSWTIDARPSAGRRTSRRYVEAAAVSRRAVASSRNRARISS